MAERARGLIAIQMDTDFVAHGGTGGHVGSPVGPSRPVKRSFTIAGHRTSISLENAFWEALRDIAVSEERSLASIVAEIDKNRANAGLSGAVRIWVLEYFRRRQPDEPAD
jgi:predicted DNA-binding ribbon-helix-helix protein